MTNSSARSAVCLWSVAGPPAHSDIRAAFIDKLYKYSSRHSRTIRKFLNWLKKRSARYGVLASVAEDGDSRK